MSKIPEGDRAKVAYLLGDKGTNTIAKNSYQGQVIDLVADNVADLGKVSGSGAGVEIGMEQLAIWDPAVILFGPDSIYDTVGSDAAFADLSAVKNGSYYKVPGTPWNWLNSPPTVNQVAGHAVAAAPAVPRAVRQRPVQDGRQATSRRSTATT